MIRNNLIYGFNENGVIGYTKNAIGDMSVLVHEYAHTYYKEHHDELWNLEDYDFKRLNFVPHNEFGEKFGRNVRFAPLFKELEEVIEKMGDSYYDDNTTITTEYDNLKCEYFSTGIGIRFKKIQRNLPTYNSVEDMRKNLPIDVEKLLPKDSVVGGLRIEDEILIDVLQSMCGKQQKQEVKQEKTISMKDIKEQAKKVCETGTEQEAFIQGAIWALEQSGIKVEETETKVEEKIETPKEKKPKKATAKKSTGKPKKATKKAKVADKPKYEIGTIFEDDSIIIGYKNGKYQIVTKNDELVEMTEKEIDEA